jgi:hypothetical protein
MLGYLSSVADRGVHDGRLGIVHASSSPSFSELTPRASFRKRGGASLIDGGDPALSIANKESRLSFREMLRRMSPHSIANLLALNVQTILSTLADNIYSAWIPLFLVEVYKMNKTETGFYAALPLLGGALGGAMGGWLNDQLILRTVAIAGRDPGGAVWKGDCGCPAVGRNAWLRFAASFASCCFVKLFSDWVDHDVGVVTDIGGGLPRHLCT